MEQNIFLTTSQYQNNASTFAQQYGGVVAVSYTVFVSQDGNLSTTNSNSTIHEIWGLKIVEWHQNNEDYYVVVENIFSRVGVMILPDIFLISSSGDSLLNFNDEYSALRNYAETLNKNSDVNVYVIGSEEITNCYPKT